MTLSMDEARKVIAERIEEAAETLRRMPDRERDLLRKGERGQSWPVMLHQACEHAAYQGLKTRLPPPSAARITRMNQVLDWLLELARIERKYFTAVWLTCAERRGPSEVGRTLGADRKTVSKYVKAGLTLLVVRIV